MSIVIVDNPRYIEAVSRNKDSAPEEVNYVVTQKLGGIDSYFWGGAVREPIFHAMYNGQEPVTDDWDIIADDSFQPKPLELDKIFASEIVDGSAIHNRYGTIKWVPREGVEIDVSRFSNANMIRDGETEERSIDVVLAGCDFNTGSIAYGLHNGKIYDGGAMDGLKSRTVDLQYGEDELNVMMARLVLHSNDMRFAIGPSGLHLITSRYTKKTADQIDADISTYLERKHKGQRLKEVTNRLKEIAQLT